MHDAKAIRKHTAQHDLFNRIHSIAADGAFVKRVAEGWYVGRFEVVRECRHKPEATTPAHISQPEMRDMVLRSIGP
jgi:hypothetical protein